MGGRLYIVGRGVTARFAVFTCVYNVFTMYLQYIPSRGRAGGWLEGEASSRPGLITLAGGKDMSDLELEKQSMQDEFEEREAGVADMMEFYEKVAPIYARAAAAIAESHPVYTSDSTDIRRADAYLGRNPQRTQ